MKKTIFALALTLSTVFVSGEIVEGIVIRVGDRIFTRSMYEERLHSALDEMKRSVDPADYPAKEAQFRKTMLNDLVSELLVKDRADRLNLSVSKEETEAAIDRLKKQYGIETDEQFVESLKQSGLSRPVMESRLRDTLLTNKVFARELRSRQELSDRELRERYEREKERYRLPERAEVREIIVVVPEGADQQTIATLEAKAAAVAARATAGEDFAKLATEFSDSPTKDQGGSLGTIARGELLPVLENAVFNSGATGVGGPVRTPAGFHVLKVEKRLPSEVPGFDTVKDKLRQEVSDETFQRDYTAYIERLRKEAFVQINEAMIPPS